MQNRSARSRVGEPLTLEFVAAVEVEAFDAFYRRRAPAQITIAGKTMALAAVWPAPNREDQPLCTIAFTLGDMAGKLALAAICCRTEALPRRPAHRRETTGTRSRRTAAGVRIEKDLEWIESKLAETVTISSIEQEDSVLDETALRLS